MKFLIVCQHWPLCTGRYLTDAFTRLGVDVRHIGAAKGGDIGMADAPQPLYAWTPQGDWNTAWSDWKPDLVIFAETLYEYWRHEVYADVPHIQINTSGPMTKPMRDIQHTFTAVSFGDIWNTTQAVSWLPCAYNPAFTPSPIPWRERDYDVTLIGRLDIYRKPILSRLEDAGFKVFRGVGIIYDEYEAIYHNSRIGLIQETARTVPCRVFEMPALGVLSLSPRYPEYEALNVPPGLEFDEEQPGSEIKAVNYALEHPDWAEEQIRQAGAWVQRHTWLQRAERVLQWWERYRDYEGKTA